MPRADATAGTDTPVPEKSFFKIIVHSFFIIPFLIAVLCVLLFAGIYLLTREQRGVYDYLEDIKTGGLTKRWQGAFELSRILANPKLVPQDDRFVPELTLAFENAENDDPRTRQYIALAMGRTGIPEFAKPLTASLHNEREESLPALIYALGMLGQREAASDLHFFAEHPSSRIRSITVAALGELANPESRDILARHLNDTEPNVQWGAAVALAQMSDPSGKPVLLQMLDRQYWSQFAEVDRDEQIQLMLTAMRVSVALNDNELLSQIRHIADSDQNLKIRDAATDFLRAQ